MRTIFMFSAGAALVMASLVWGLPSDAEEPVLVSTTVDVGPLQAAARDLPVAVYKSPI